MNSITVSDLVYTHEDPHYEIMFINSVGQKYWRHKESVVDVIDYFNLWYNTFKHTSSGLIISREIRDEYHRLSNTTESGYSTLIVDDILKKYDWYPEVRYFSSDGHYYNVSLKGKDDAF